MTRIGKSILDSGDPFPKLTAASVHHGRIELPVHFGGWGVLLIYRAHW